MRWLLRSLLFSLITLPLFYLFGLPYMLEHMITPKLRNEQYTSCLDQMKDKTALVTQPKVEAYCRCVSDGLTFTENDLWDAAQKKEPVALTKQVQAQVSKCGQKLQSTQEDVIYITP